MVTEDQKLTPEIQQRIIADLLAYRVDHPVKGQPVSWSRLAHQIGVAPSTLTEVVKHKYCGDLDKIVRQIDRFLAEARERAGRYDLRTHARITMTQRIFGVIRTGIRNNTMPVIIGSAGIGKTAHARAFALDRGGVVFIRPDEAHTDDRGVTVLLCNAIDGLRQFINQTHRKRLMEIRAWLRKHGSTVLIVDEAQKLGAKGLEMLRDIHDESDVDGRHNVPIVFFGDHHFYKLLLRGRAGERSPIRPQMTRRMTPVLDIDRDCRVDESGGQYRVDDVIEIVRNTRVKLLSADGLRWILALANVDGYGKLGFAVAVLRLAIDISLPPGEKKLRKPIDAATLEAALKMTVGDSIALEIDEQTGGELLAKVS